MDEKEVPRERLQLKDKPGLLSRLTWPALPVRRCRHRLWVRVPRDDRRRSAGAIVVAQTVGFPAPVGATIPLPIPLVASQVVRARQRLGSGSSDWSVAVMALDHTKEFQQVRHAP